MPRIWRSDEIPYPLITRKLFSRSAKQKLIPFLGAGVSVSSRSLGADPDSSDHAPAIQAIEGAIEYFDLPDKARLFLIFAVRIAYQLAERERSGHQLPSGLQLEEQLKNLAFPPTADELSEVLSLQSGFSSLEYAVEKLAELLADVEDIGQQQELADLAKQAIALTGFGRPVEPLSAVSRHFERLGNRETLYELLAGIFDNKTTPTPTHQLLALAAKHHLHQPWEDADRHYYLLTTNYDCLLEAGLKQLGVPYVALTTQSDDGQTRARFDHTLANADQLEALNEPCSPRDFLLRLPDDRQRLAVIYKMHGSLSTGTHAKVDDVVISDRDYARFIARMWGEAGGVIPAEVSRVIENKEFLFLGYSLRDWNVRGVFEKIFESRKLKKEDSVDYTVVNALTKYDEVFLDDSVHVLLADLNTFVGEIRAIGPDLPGGGR